MPDDSQARVERLFDTEYAGLCRLAGLIVGDDGRAEEIVMEAFLRTLTGWRRIRDEEKAAAYLRRAVVNLARSAARRRVSESTANERSLTAGRADLAPDRLVDADPVLRAVRALPVGQRSVIVLRYYADLTEADVADLLGCSIGTVKSQTAKAKASLARALAEEVS